MKNFLLSALTVLMLLNFVGCFSDDGESTNDENIKSYYVTFKIDGVQKRYACDEGYGFDYDSSDDSWSCFWGCSIENGFSMWLPGDVQSGDVYNETEVFFNVGVDNNGASYYISDQPFTLTVSQWSDTGGIAKGTFSGRLRNVCVVDPDYVDITDGVFEAENSGDWAK